MNAPGANRTYSASLPAQAFAALLGAFFGVALLKFGNPPVMEPWVTAPSDMYELALTTPWPIRWAYPMVTLLAATGVLAAGKIKSLPAPWRVITGAGVCWLILVWMGAFRTSSPTAILVSLHLTIAGLFFLLGAFALPKTPTLRLFWAGILIGYALMLISGWAQHFGGLEQTRRYFWMYLYPQMKEVSPEYLRKISSDRIFATQFYPNSLAGVLLLFTFPLAWFVWNLKNRFSRGARILLLVLLLVGTGGCLWWSGSKGGWLLMLLLCGGALWLAPLPSGGRAAILAVFLLGGIAGFAVKYASFFQKGATSVGARMDYWAAAARITAAHPFAGTGPGTFGAEYNRIKRPESEPARLAHNDYLQQASDSGIPAAAAYALFLGIAIYAGRPRGRLDLRLPEAGANGRMARMAAWLGVLGWALHSFIDFVLYVPALAWPAFGILGWLVAEGTRASGESSEKRLDLPTG